MHNPNQQNYSQANRMNQPNIPRNNNNQGNIFVTSNSKPNNGNQPVNINQNNDDHLHVSKLASLISVEKNVKELKDNNLLNNKRLPENNTNNENNSIKKQKIE